MHHHVHGFEFLGLIGYGIEWILVRRGWQPCASPQRLQFSLQLGPAFTHGSDCTPRSVSVCAGVFSRQLVAASSTAW